MSSGPGMPDALMPLIEPLPFVSKPVVYRLNTHVRFTIVIFDRALENRISEESMHTGLLGPLSPNEGLLHARLTSMSLELKSRLLLFDAV